MGCLRSLARLVHLPPDDVNRHPDGEEARANAHLIAAAPELLDALQWWVERLENPATVSESEATAVMTEALYKARAAIAKATGQ